MIFTIVFFFLEKHKLPSIKNSIIGLSVFLILTLPYLIGLASKIIAKEASSHIWPDICIDYFSLHIHNLFRPSPILSLYREIPYINVPMKHVTNVFAGYIPLFFAAFALVNLKNISHEKRKIIIFWLITGALFFLLALGPYCFGKDQSLNKFSLYNLLCSGLLRQIRIPVRFSLVTLIAIYIIASFGVERFTKLNKQNLLNNKNLCLFLVLLQIAEFLPIPYPLLSLKTPEIYYKLASQNTNSPILVLPLGWQSSYKTVGIYDKKIQFHQTIHGHPIFQGQIARIEDSYFDYYTQQDGFRYLIDANKRLPTSSETKGVHNILRTYGIKNVVIHNSYFDSVHLNILLEIFKDYPGELTVEFAT
ncbi:MAG: hypothetical protein KJ957_04125 [Candidatus Omnitrophica bacterium]|nr:hypothetical protein [Candidatus Omnitrophota bacterium]